MVKDLGIAEISFVIISNTLGFVKKNIRNFSPIFGNPIHEVGKYMKFWKNSMLFSLGGAGYMGLEVLWRGYSHGSMFLAGGTCFLLLGYIGKQRLPFAVQCALGALAVTGVELAAGLTANASYSVWDYRSLPLNFQGQICLPYTLLWYPVSFGGILLFRALEKRVASVCR